MVNPDQRKMCTVKVVSKSTSIHEVPSVEESICEPKKEFCFVHNGEQVWISFCFRMFKEILQDPNLILSTRYGTVISLVIAVQNPVIQRQSRHFVLSKKLYLHQRIQTRNVHLLKLVAHILSRVTPGLHLYWKYLIGKYSLIISSVCCRAPCRYYDQYLYINGICHLPKKLGQRCNYHAQCFVNNLVCNPDPKDPTGSRNFFEISCTKTNFVTIQTRIFQKGSTVKANRMRNISILCPAKYYDILSILKRYFGLTKKRNLINSMLILNKYLYKMRCTITLFYHLKND